MRGDIDRMLGSDRRGRCRTVSSVLSMELQRLEEGGACVSHALVYSLPVCTDGQSGRTVLDAQCTITTSFIMLVVQF